MAVRSVITSTQRGETDGQISTVRPESLSPKPTRQAARDSARLCTWLFSASVRPAVGFLWLWFVRGEDVRGRARFVLVERRPTTTVKIFG